MKVLLKNKKYCIGLSLLFILLACETEFNYELPSGQLIGDVSLDSKQIDNEGVEVVVEGSDPQITVYTDKNGRFVIDDLSSGTYNFVFNKEGYYQDKIIGRQFVGGNIPDYLVKTLYRKTFFRFENFNVTHVYTVHTHGVRLNITADIIGYDDSFGGYGFRCYINNDPNVNHKNFMGSYASYFFSGMSDNFEINTLKYPRGSDLYLVLYPSINPYVYYPDLSSGRIIFSAIDFDNPSEVVKITIPELEP